jgi:hypothetical protein
VRNIRVIGTLYMYVNRFGRTAFCKVNPRSGGRERQAL